MLSHVQFFPCKNIVKICNFMDYSLPASSVHGITQARILVAIPSPGESSPPSARTWVSYIAGRFFSI